jgi:hypothetical protein
MTEADVLAIVDAAPVFVDQAVDHPAAIAEAIRKLGLAELDDALRQVSTAEGEARMPALQAASARIGALAAAEALHEGFAKAALENAAAASDLIRDEGLRAVKKTIAAGIKLGKKKPRDLSHVRREVFAHSTEELSEAREREIELRAADLVRQWEMADTRDAWHHTGEAPPRATQSAKLPEGGSDGKPPGRPSGFGIDEINRSYALAIWGGKAVVVNEQPHGPVNDRVRIMSFDSMNSWFANRYTEIRGADGKKRSVTWARAWHQHPDRRQYDGVEFFPNPDGAEGTPNYLNLWRGFSVTPSESGSCAKFKDHLRVNVCQEDEGHFRYLIGSLAHIVQRPRARAGIALVLRGGKGTGKTKVGEVVGSLFAPHYFLVDDARYLTGQFNAHMASCLLLQADEAMWAGDKAAEGRLKGLITSDMQMVEAKGIDPIRMKNFVHVIMTSNEDWVVPASGDERRFFVLDVGSRCQRNNVYFAEIDDELDRGGRERLLYELLSFDLDQFNIYDTPQTKALLDQKIGSLSPLDEFWYGRLHDGYLIHGDDAWRKVVPLDTFYGEYKNEIKSRNIGRVRSSPDFGKHLRKLAAICDTRPVLEREPGVMRQTRCYEMPSLAECRNSFEKYLGQRISWPAVAPDHDEAPASKEGPDAGDFEM